MMDEVGHAVMESTTSPVISPVTKLGKIQQEASYDQFYSTESMFYKHLWVHH